MTLLIPLLPFGEAVHLLRRPLSSVDCPDPSLRACRVFCMPTSEEFGKDWYLSRKIALLWWVEPSHFDIVLDYNSLEVTHKVEQAKAG